MSTRSQEEYSELNNTDINKFLSAFEVSEVKYSLSYQTSVEDIDNIKIVLDRVDTPLGKIYSVDNKGNIQGAADVTFSNDTAIIRVEISKNLPPSISEPSLIEYLYHRILYEIYSDDQSLDALEKEKKFARYYRSYKDKI